MVNKNPFGDRRIRFTGSVVVEFDVETTASDEQIKALEMDNLSDSEILAEFGILDDMNLDSTDVVDIWDLDVFFEGDYDD